MTCSEDICWYVCVGGGGFLKMTVESEGMEFRSVHILYGRSGCRAKRKKNFAFVELR